MVNIDNTEEKIIESAKEVFAEKGFAGARMQEIADNAGVNKALLNYYFRSKEKLFEIAFKMIFKPMIDNINEALDHDGNIFEIIENFTRQHFRFIRKNPQAPIVMAKELSTSKGIKTGSIVSILIEQIKSTGFPNKIAQRLEKSVQSGEIRNIDPIQLIISILSLNIMYIVIKPVYTSVFADKIPNIDQFEEEREDEIVNLILSSLKNIDYKPTT